MNSPWWTLAWVAAGLAFGWAGEPWLKRHPLAGCAFFAFFAVFFLATAVLNAVVLGAWGWTVLEAALAAASAYGFWKYRGRRKHAKASPA